MLRARRARREESQGAQVPESIVDRASSSDPEQEIVLADSVGVALLWCSKRSRPQSGWRSSCTTCSVHRSTRSRRLSADRSPRRSSLRAARGVAYTGARRVSDAKLGKQRELVEAFLAASRSATSTRWSRHSIRTPPCGPTRSSVRGASLVAKQAFAYSRANVRGSVRVVRVALVNGAVGLVVAAQGRLTMALTFKIARDKIAAIEVIRDRARLAASSSECSRRSGRPAAPMRRRAGQRIVSGVLVARTRHRLQGDDALP